MKKILFTFVVLFNLNISFSQNELSNQPSDLPDIKILAKQIEELQKQNSNNSSNINTLLTSSNLDAANKYTIIKQNLTNSITTFQLLNNKINILKANASSHTLDSYIRDLGSPESNALGFKLNETIIRLINENIQPKKKNLSKKILETVSSITKSPIVSNIPTIAPAISITNSVLDVLRSTSIMEDKVDNQKIDAFETALNKYTQYYAALNDGNVEFRYGLENQSQSLGLLHQKLYDQVTFFAKTLNYPLPTKGQNEDVGPYLLNLFNNFNKHYIDNLFNTLEANNTINRRINYDTILASNNGNLKDANNRLEEFIGLINQFEFQYTNYFNIYEVSNSRIIRALNIAEINEISDKTTIDNKKANFEILKDKAIKDIQLSLNLNELLLSKQSIKYTARIL